MVIQPHIVLIDDDELIQAAWKLSAHEKKHDLMCFDSSDAFLKASIDKKTPIYIDYHFLSGENGLEVAKRLHNHGYQNLFITTGSTQTLDKKIPNIQNVVGKEYPR